MLRKPRNVPNFLFEGGQLLLRNRSGRAIGCIVSIGNLDALELKWTDSDRRIFYYSERSGETWISRSDMKYLGIYKKFHKSVSQKLLPRKKELHGNSSPKKSKQSAIVAEWSSRGSFSFHFGHFILDTLPYLACLEELGWKAGTIRMMAYIYKPKQWAKEIMDMLGFQINHESFIYIDESGESLDADIRPPQWIRPKNLPTHFLKVSTEFKYKLLQKGFSWPETHTHRTDTETSWGSIVILSRLGLESSKAKRWVNEEDFVMAMCANEVTVIQPELLGPNELVKTIDAHYNSIIITCQSSAAHQLLIYSDIPAIVCMLCPMNSVALQRDGELRDFQYARNRLNIIAVSGSRLGWNDDFEVSPEELKSCIRWIQKDRATGIEFADFGSLRLFRAGAW